MRRCSEPSCVEDRAHVVHPLLERADLHPVGEAHAALVEEDET